MLIGGMQKISLIDYPGEVGVTISTIGCNMRCPFCHNSHLVNGTSIKIDEKEVISFLEKRKGFASALCVTGGEPTLQKDLPDFIKKIKEMGYKIKIDTNGTNPEMVRYLIDNKLVDYIAMDIKSSLEYDKYNKTVGNVLTKEMFNSILKTIDILLNSDIFVEFRTTMAPIIDEDDYVEIARYIKEKSKNKKNVIYSLQQFLPVNTLDKSFMSFDKTTEQKMNEVAENIKKETDISVNVNLYEQ